MNRAVREFILDSIHTEKGWNTLFSQASPEVQELIISDYYARHEQFRPARVSAEVKRRAMFELFQNLLWMLEGAKTIDVEKVKREGGFYGEDE